jgi:NitT/TauT family transport system ATP-binding protein
MLTLNGVSKTFGAPDNGADRVKALDAVSVNVKDGEFFSIIGPSGCGKSTLIRIIAGLMPEYDGAVMIETERIQWPHRWIGMVFQEESTFPWRTTLGNVEFGLEMRDVPSAARRAKALEMLELVGLGGFEQRALVMEPKILLMDEPFGALDEQTRIILGEQLLKIRDKLRQTIVFVTHNINEAVQLSDRVMVMTARPGRVKAVFNIDLPHPRDSTIIASDKFGRFVGQVWGTLREESLKGFKQTEKIDEGGRP